MGKNKGYNSILFLTTLSVYLGLVLVGAPSSVLAQQAALTQRFEIQNEFETEDDLDKKPDDETLEDFLLVRLDAALNEFVKDLRQLNRDGKYKTKKGSSTGFSASFCPEGITSRASSIVFDDNNWSPKALFNFSKKLDVSKGSDDIDNLPSFIEASQQYENEFCKFFDVGINLDKDELKVKISFSQNPQNAFITAENLNSLFSIKALNAQNAVTKQFYENTRAKADNQYVRIVTRLPRGSLNALVKSEKQAN